MKPCFVNGGIEESGNSIDPGQPAQCTQAGQSRNFLFFVNFMHVKGPVKLVFLPVVLQSGLMVRIYISCLPLNDASGLLTLLKKKTF